MDLMEWIMVIAIIDGPMLGLLYFIWRKIRYEIRDT